MRSSFRLTGPAGTRIFSDRRCAPNPVSDTPESSDGSLVEGFPFKHQGRLYKPASLKFRGEERWIVKLSKGLRRHSFPANGKMSEVRQIKLEFSSRQDALQFCNDYGYICRISIAKRQKMKKKLVDKPGFSAQSQMLTVFKPDLPFELPSDFVPAAGWEATLGSEESAEKGILQQATP
uniref:Uncharacterized protein n=1 Tax=Lotharella oceanica TaxID=641309 RepID=A0A7S2XEA8_9EUKA